MLYIWARGALWTKLRCTHAPAALHPGRPDGTRMEYSFAPKMWVSCREGETLASWWVAHSCMQHRSKLEVAGIHTRCTGKTPTAHSMHQVTTTDPHGPS